jgi:hypothetical protein
MLCLSSLSRPILQLLPCTVQDCSRELVLLQGFPGWWTPPSAVRDAQLLPLQIASETREAIREQERRSGSSRVRCFGVHNKWPACRSCVQASAVTVVIISQRQA